MALYDTDSKQFQKQKDQCLSGVDLSRKGSVDAPILELVNYINAQRDCFTTSSCSGRVIVVDNTGEEGEVQKRGCQWLYVTHQEAWCESVKASLSKTEGAATFKFEPMVMHIQVQSLQFAQRLHATAVASGFRNSGISIGGKGKIIVAVRSTHSLEVPLSYGGKVLVSDLYIEHLVHCANKKMQENITRISRVLDNFKRMVANLQEKVNKGKEANPKHQACLSATPKSVQLDQTQSHKDAISFQGKNSVGDSDDLFECVDGLFGEET